MLCQGRHGAAGILAASWPTLRITGLNPFHPSSSSSLSPSFLPRASGLLCKAGQAESVGGLSSTHVSGSYLYDLPSWWETRVQTVSSYLLCDGWKGWSPSWRRIPISEAHYLESRGEFGSNRCWSFRIPKRFWPHICSSKLDDFDQMCNYLVNSQNWWFFKSKSWRKRDKPKQTEDPPLPSCGDLRVLRLQSSNMDNSLQPHHAFSICGLFYGFSTVNIIPRKKKHKACVVTFESYRNTVGCLTTFTLNLLIIWQRNTLMGKKTVQHYKKKQKTSSVCIVK